MFCRQCGARVNEGDIICLRCGTPIANGRSDANAAYPPPCRDANPTDQNNIGAPCPPPHYSQQFNEYHGSKASSKASKSAHAGTIIIIVAAALIAIVGIAAIGPFAGRSIAPKYKAPDEQEQKQLEDASSQQKNYSNDEQNLAIGETAQYSKYEITLISVEPYEAGNRALFEIYGKRDASIKRYWFEGTSVARESLSIDEASNSAADSLPEKIDISERETTKGYVYFTGGELASIRFSGGIFGSDRIWNLEQSDSAVESLETNEYASALAEFGLSADEAESVRLLFEELGIGGCQIAQTEALFGTGIDELQSFRTWIEINPADWSDNHGGEHSSHQINFTFENRQIFYVEITGFVSESNPHENFILYDTDQSGYIARYIPETDSVEPWQSQ